MKKIFTLLLMFACAMFIGVSCVQYHPDGPAKEVIDEVTPETFEIEFNESTRTCAHADYYCVPANKTKPYMLISNQEFEDETIKPNIDSNAKTVKAKLASLLQKRILIGELIYPVDNYALYKGDSKNYPKSATRTSNDEKVEIYVVGVKINEVKSQVVLDAELSTEVFTIEVPFKPYPVLTLGKTAVNVSSAAGSENVDCTLKNPVEGYEMRCECAEKSCKWVRPSYENGVLTIAYDENPYAISRKAEVVVEYGKYVEVKEGDNKKQVWEPLVYGKTVSIAQEANLTAPKYTFNLEVVGSYFNKVVVNITPSDNALADNVDYVARVHMPTSDWASVAVGNMKYPESNTYLNGKKENHIIKVEPRNLDIYDKEKYCVYVYAVDKDHTAPISEVSTAEVTYTTEGTPKLGFEEKEVAEGDGAHYKVFNNGGDWNIEVTKGGLIEVPFDVENPVEGAAVYFNDGNMVQEKTLSAYDNDKGVVGNNGLVSTKDGKFVFTANDYPSNWDKTYPPYINISIKYTDVDQTFCVTQSIKVKLIK